jgi:AraC-like DNA-binding protein
LAIGVAVLPASVTDVPERVCASYELSWMIEGAATATVGGQEYELPWSTAFLARPGDRVAFRYHDTGTRTHHGYVHFTIPGTRIRTDWPRARQLENDDLLLALLEHVLWLDAERPDDWAQAANEAVRYAIRVFASGYSGRVVGDGRTFPDVVVRALDVLMPAWTDGSILPTPTLDELAESAGVGREYLCRIFAQEIGLPPLTTLRLLRLSRAASLLRVTSMPVGQIGRATGFASEFHFSRTFRTHFGVSPTRYRTSGSQEHLSLPPAIHRINAMLSSS